MKITSFTNDIMIEEKEYFTDKFVKISYLPEKKTAICQAKTGFIPFEEFKLVFEKIGELVKKYKITKLIFDKTKLTTFHQASMEWYHVKWKPEMYFWGLKSHRKLLPNDKIFRESVRIGREKIVREHPEFSIEKYDIRYCESIEEAIEL